MRQLTKKRELGAGYSIESGAVPEVITKLGKLEHEAFDLIGETCHGYCKYIDAYDAMEDGQERLEEKCAECPLEKLADMIWRG